MRYDDDDDDEFSLTPEDSRAWEDLRRHLVAHPQASVHLSRMLETNIPEEPLRPPEYLLQKAFKMLWGD